MKIPAHCENLPGYSAICFAVSGLLISCSTSTGIEDTAAVETRVSSTGSVNAREPEQNTMNESVASQQTRELRADLDMPVATMRALNPEVSVGEAIEIEFSVENTAGPQVSLLPWGSPMESELTGPAFNIVRIGSDGQSTDVPYGGLMIRRAPPTDSDYVVLPTGVRLVNTLSLDQSYSLSEPGTYQISFAPLGLSSANVFTMGETEVYMQNPVLRVVRN